MEQDYSYTVQQMAEMSGVSVRTLHHYDAIGLVSPKRAANNYRCYKGDEVDRLQQVLLYRQSGVALDDIKRILDDPCFDVSDALVCHLKELQLKKNNLEDLIVMVERTIENVREGATMADEEKFKTLKKNAIEQNEQCYGQEIRERWGSEAVDGVTQKISGMAQQGYEQAKELEILIAEALVEGVQLGDPTGEIGRRVANMHRQWLCMFWKEGMYSSEAHRGLADMYLADERFQEYYGTITPGATQFLRDAIWAYCE